MIRLDVKPHAKDHPHSFFLTRSSLRLSNKQYRNGNTIKLPIYLSASPSELRAPDQCFPPTSAASALCLLHRKSSTHAGKFCYFNYHYLGLMFYYIYIENLEFFRNFNYSS